MGARILLSTMTAKMVAETRQSGYLMVALRRAHGGCGANEDVIIHGFGHGWPSTVSLGDGYQRYGPTYFNATLVITGLLPETPSTARR